MSMTLCNILRRYESRYQMPAHYKMPLLWQGYIISHAAVKRGHASRSLPTLLQGLYRAAVNHAAHRLNNITCNPAARSEGDMTQPLTFGPRFKPKKTTTTPTGRSCPVCKIGELVKRKGRFGEFIGCGRYPACGYTEDDSRSKQQNLDAAADRFLKAHGCGHLVRKT